MKIFCLEEKRVRIEKIIQTRHDRVSNSIVGNSSHIFCFILSLKHSKEYDGSGFMAVIACLCSVDSYCKQSDPPCLLGIYNNQSQCLANMQFLWPLQTKIHAACFFLPVPFIPNQPQHHYFTGLVKHGRKTWIPIAEIFGMHITSKYLYSCHNLNHVLTWIIPFKLKLIKAIIHSWRQLHCSPLPGSAKEMSCEIQEETRQPLFLNTTK